MIPLFKFKINGHSMEPTFKDGDMVLVNKLSYFFIRPKIGNVVVLKRDKYIIKRIKKIDEDRFFVVGDNKKESTDSRKFGWIKKKDILGKVILKL